MGGVMNGMALHGGVIPVGGTFFVFSDYMRPAVRLAAMRAPKVVFVWTHDSVGPRRGRAHAPAGRAPGLAAGHAGPARDPPGRRQRDGARRGGSPSRPTARSAWCSAGRTCPVLEGTAGNEVGRGAPTCWPSLRTATGEPDLVLIGTGSEVQGLRRGGEHAAADGTHAGRVDAVWDLFDAQHDAYQDTVLPPEVPTLAVEAGATLGWDRWADDASASTASGRRPRGGGPPEPSASTPRTWRSGGARPTRAC